MGPDLTFCFSGRPPFPSPASQTTILIPALPTTFQRRFYGDWEGEGAPRCSVSEGNMPRPRTKEQKQRDAIV